MPSAFRWNAEAYSQRHFRGNDFVGGRSQGLTVGQNPICGLTVPLLTAVYLGLRADTRRAAKRRTAKRRAAKNRPDLPA